MADRGADMLECRDRGALFGRPLSRFVALAVATVAGCLTVTDKSLTLRNIQARGATDAISIDATFGC